MWVRSHCKAAVSWTGKWFLAMSHQRSPPNAPPLALRPANSLHNSIRAIYALSTVLAVPHLIHAMHAALISILIQTRHCVSMHAPPALSHTRITSSAFSVPTYSTVKCAKMQFNAILATQAIRSTQYMKYAVLTLWIAPPAMPVAANAFHARVIFSWRCPRNRRAVQWMIALNVQSTILHAYSARHLLSSVLIWSNVANRTIASIVTSFLSNVCRPSILTSYSQIRIMCSPVLLIAKYAKTKPHVAHANNPII